MDRFTIVKEGNFFRISFAKNNIPCYLGGHPESSIPSNIPFWINQDPTGGDTLSLRASGFGEFDSVDTYGFGAIYVQKQELANFILNEE